MVPGAYWRSIKGRINDLASMFWTADPIAQMQYEYDLAVNQLKEGREGLEQCRALVDRVGRQVANEKSHVSSLEGKVKAYLETGDRETAARFALELQKSKNALTENEGQLKLHEEAFNNCLAKIKQTGGKLAQIRDKVSKFDAKLKLSKAEMEMAKLARDFNFDGHVDFGQMGQIIQDRIILNRARINVSPEDTDLHREQAMEKSMAEQALREYEVQVGLVTTKNAKAPEPRKDRRLY